MVHDSIRPASSGKAMTAVFPGSYDPEEGTSSRAQNLVSTASSHEREELELFRPHEIEQSIDQPQGKLGYDSMHSQLIFRNALMVSVCYSSIKGRATA